MRLSAKACVAFVIAVGAVGATAHLAAQATFEQTVQDLESSDARVRLKAARLLNETSYPEAAVPLARVVTDPEPEVQLQAIAAELNIFRADRIAKRSKLGALIEGPTAASSETLFSQGPLGLGPIEVPAPVLAALLNAAVTGDRRVGVEALYAFGALAAEPGGARRRDLLSVSAADLVALTLSKETAMRLAAVRVAGRVYQSRPGDLGVDTKLGDAIVATLNDKDRSVRVAAMDALGAMRYVRAVQALAGLFDYHEKGDLAVSALTALARIGHASSAPIFLAQLTSGNPVWKTAAIEGLSRIGNRANLGAIQAALSAERNDGVLLAGNFAATCLANDRLEPIAEGLRRPMVHDQARAYLAELATVSQRVFSPYLQDPDPRMRVDMLDALSLGREGTALPLVMPLVRDPDPQVVRAAERAVARLR